MPTIVFLVIVLLSAPLAWAQPKTDVVALPNGDRITGEIKSVSRGKLEFKTDDAGTLDIEWEKVLWVEATTRQFEVVTTDGRRILGHLRHMADRFVLVSGAGGDVSLAVVEVTNILPIGASFFEKLDGSIDAGYSYTRSSGVTQTTLNGLVNFRRAASTFRVQGSATLTGVEGDEERDDRGAIGATFVSYKGGDWFYAAFGRFETNESLGLVLRSQIGGGVGLRLVNTNRGQFEFGGGLVVNEEVGVDTEPTENIEGHGEARASFYTFDSPKTELSMSFQYFAGLSNWGRQRLQLDVTVRHEVLKDFHLALNLFDSFDSAPPNPEAAQNDIGVVISAGWSY